MKQQYGFFDEQFRFEKIDQDGKDPLKALKEKIDWEIFRSILNKAMSKDVKGPGGRPAYDYVMMFKILIVQQYYDLSDDAMEIQLLDRMTFMRFIGVRVGDHIPDAKTIWNFREQLKTEGVVEQLFNRFYKQLEKQGLILNKGKIIDAQIVEVPVQRNSKEENEQVKNGDIPDEWNQSPNKLRQKDTQARWTKKGSENFFGYKNHIKTDAKSKLIDCYQVTEANVHDSQTVESLLTKKDRGQKLYGDSGYSGQAVEQIVKKKKMIDRIHEKGNRHHLLTAAQFKRNTAKSRIRARVEHVFGFIVNSMCGNLIRTIGKARAAIQIGLHNIAYNLFRSIQLSRAKCA